MLDSLCASDLTITEQEEAVDKVISLVDSQMEQSPSLPMDFDPLEANYIYFSKLHQLSIPKLRELTRTFSAVLNSVITHTGQKKEKASYIIATFEDAIEKCKGTELQLAQVEALFGLVRRFPAP